MPTCPSENTVEVDQSDFWGSGKIHWTPHRIGWAISGGCAVLTTIITIYSVSTHARNYRVPAEQRQVIRILYLPMVYAIISFLSYRFFRDYTYYSLVEIAYEALTISAFLLLLIQFVAATAHDRTAESALARKEKKKLMFPFCCWRYRPTKMYFMYTTKWAVLQYAVVRPLVSIAGIIAQAENVLCESVWSVHYAYVYLTAIDFASISIALYGLLLFYELTKDELKGRRPLAKFMCIKLIVFFTFYQTFVFELLQKHGVIHATEFWTESNIVDGLNALVTTIEMVFFALGMLWAYRWSEYRSENLGPRLGVGKALLDSINYSDFAREIYTSLRFFIYYLRTGRREPREEKDRLEKGQVDFETAFGFANPSSAYYGANGSEDSKGLFRGAGAQGVGGRTMSPSDESNGIGSPDGRGPEGIAMTELSGRR